MLSSWKVTNTGDHRNSPASPDLFKCCSITMDLFLDRDMVFDAVKSGTGVNVAFSEEFLKRLDGNKHMARYYQGMIETLLKDSMKLAKKEFTEAYEELLETI